MATASRIAVEHLRQRGGALINVGSVESDRAMPLHAAYAASKHAMKAYTDALRVELEHDDIPVSVTLIKPTGIDTPFFRHAAHYMDKQGIAPSPLYAPETVAEAILHAAENPTRDLLVGDLAPVQAGMDRFGRRLGDKVLIGMVDMQKSERQPRPEDNQALHQPSGRLEERGDYDDVWTAEHSMYTKAAMNPMLAGTLVVGAGLAVAAILRSRSHSGSARN